MSHRSIVHRSDRERHGRCGCAAVAISDLIREAVAAGFGTVVRVADAGRFNGGGAIARAGRDRHIAIVEAAVNVRVVTQDVDSDRAAFINCGGIVIGYGIVINSHDRNRHGVRAGIVVSEGHTDRIHIRGRAREVVVQVLVRDVEAAAGNSDRFRRALTPVNGQLVRVRRAGVAIGAG